MRATNTRLTTAIALGGFWVQPSRALGRLITLDNSVEGMCSVAMCCDVLWPATPATTTAVQWRVAWAVLS